MRSPRQEQPNQGQWRLPPQQKDEGLAAIMARRRAMADSKGADTTALAPSKPQTQQCIVDPDLRAAMERRKFAVPIESPRISRPKTTTSSALEHVDLRNVPTNDTADEESAPTGLEHVELRKVPTNSADADSVDSGTSSDDEEKNGNDSTQEDARKRVQQDEESCSSDEDSVKEENANVGNESSVSSGSDDDRSQEQRSLEQDAVNAGNTDEQKSVYGEDNDDDAESESSEDTERNNEKSTDECSANENSVDEARDGSVSIGSQSEAESSRQSEGSADDNSANEASVEENSVEEAAEKGSIDADSEAGSSDHEEGSAFGNSDESSENEVSADENSVRTESDKGSVDDNSAADTNGEKGPVDDHSETGSSDHSKSSADAISADENSIGENKADEGSVNEDSADVADDEGSADEGSADAADDEGSADEQSVGENTTGKNSVSENQTDEGSSRENLEDENSAGDMSADNSAGENAGSADEHGEDENFEDENLVAENSEEEDSAGENPGSDNSDGGNTAAGNSVDGNSAATLSERENSAGGDAAGENAMEEDTDASDEDSDMNGNEGSESSVEPSLQKPLSDEDIRSPDEVYTTEEVAEDENHLRGYAANGESMSDDGHEGNSLSSSSQEHYEDEGSIGSHEESPQHSSSHDGNSASRYESGNSAPDILEDDGPSSSNGVQFDDADFQPTEYEKGSRSGGFQDGRADEGNVMSDEDAPYETDESAENNLRTDWPPDSNRATPERDDSFFSDPPSVASDYTFTTQSTQKEAHSILGHLSIVSEEQTIDLLETDYERSVAYSARVKNDDQSTAPSYGDQSALSGVSSTQEELSFDNQSQYDTTTDGDRSGQNENDDQSDSSDSSESSHFDRFFDNNEDDTVVEIDTIDSSVVSFDSHDDVTGWNSSRHKHSLLDQHMRAEDNSFNFLEEGEKSILGELSVLDVVHEETSIDENESGSLDFHSSRAASLASRDSELGRKKDRHSHVGSRVLSVAEEGEDDEVDNESDSDGSQSQNDTNKKTMTRSPCNGVCSKKIISILVLLASVVIGLGVGLLFFPRTTSQRLVAGTQAPSPAPTENLPDLPTDQLEVYQQVCELLVEECERLLLSVRTPQKFAFDWLVNDKAANPNLPAISYENRIQRYALATIYFSTMGDQWSATNNWLSSAHECDWYSSNSFGSICDSTGNALHSLILENNNLRGEIPFEIALLTSLRSISLRNPIGSAPSISGTLPTSVGSLSALTSLTISGNRFSTGIPSEYGQLTRLTNLDLSNNGLNGEIPLSLQGLSNLVKLNFSGNHISGGIKQGILARASKLEEINVAGNLLSALPTSLGGLASLRLLNVANNELIEFPRQVTQLSRLFDLDLSHNNIRGRLPAQLAHMVALESLNLSGNNFSGSFPIEYCSLRQLRTLLDVSHNELTGTIPSRIGQLVNLERLVLTGNEFSGSLPVELAFLNHMEEIRLDQNDFTGFVPAQLCALYDTIEPSASIDCEEVTQAFCFRNCCTDGGGCRCQYEKTEPFRCIEGLK